jgi:BlaI family penicillinase repressor
MKMPGHGNADSILRLANTQPRVAVPLPQNRLFGGGKSVLTEYNCTRNLPRTDVRNRDLGGPMSDRRALSKGEMEVARVLWELGEATVRQVHEGLVADRPMDFATVQTYLRRLHAKGYVNARLDGRTRVYWPKTRPQTVIRQTVNDLVERLFGGETLPLMKHLIEERGISGEDLAELRRLVDRLEEESCSHERK